MSNDKKLKEKEVSMLTTEPVLPPDPVDPPPVEDEGILPKPRPR